MAPEVGAALIAVIGVFVSVLASLWQTSRKLESEQVRIVSEERRAKERIESERQMVLEQIHLQRQEAVEEIMFAKASKRVDILRDLLGERIAKYPPVFRTLGRVPDTFRHMGPKHEMEELLIATSEEIKGHLYSDAGLIMSMEARNALHRAWFACMFYTTGKLNARDVRATFYYARRYLRSDLLFEDIDAIKSDVTVLFDNVPKVDLEHKIDNMIKEADNDMIRQFSK